MKQIILMSDVIGSRGKDQKQLMNQLKKCTQYINEKYARSIMSPLTITLGDEFQAIIKNLLSAVAIIIDIEEFLIKNNYAFKLRYVVMYGSIDTPINNKVAYEMLGEGLTIARNTINSMRMSGARFLIDIESEYQKIIINNSFNIYQNIIDKWKIAKDYTLISNLIVHKDYKVVAEMMQKERSLIWKRDKNLNMTSYNAVKEILYTITKI